MVTVELVHTAHVPSRTLVMARALLDDAFDGDFDDADWTKDPDAPHASHARPGTLHRGRGASAQSGRPPRRRQACGTCPVPGSKRNQLP